ncbi:MAG: lysostaphin resistance A-like protein [Planctomycetota bacterium]
MSAAAPLRAAAARPDESREGRGDAIAVAMAVLWFLGAWQSRSLGIWPAVGTTASLLGVLAIAIEGRALRAALGADAPRVALGVAVGLAMAWLTELLYRPVTAAVPAIGSDVAVLFRAFGDPGPRAVLLLLPLVVAAEELVWRGVVYGALARRLPMTAAIVAASVLYAIAHAPIGSPALVLTCLCAGACWTALRAWSGSLAAAIVAHLVWDLAVLVVRPILPPA